MSRHDELDAIAKEARKNVKSLRESGLQLHQWKREREKSDERKEE